MVTLRALALDIAATLLLSVCSYAQDWQPVTPADLTSGPVVEKNADAEALFWKIQVDQSMSKTVLSHYLRIKIFTERGIESQSRVDLQFSGKNTIKDISGRTIKPDGAVVVLGPDSIFDRTIAKAKKVNVQAKSIVFPSVTPGSLIEYRWTEVRSQEDPFHIPLELQRDIPVQRVEYNIKRLKIPLYASLKAFNASAEPGTATGEQLSTVVTLLPALHDEPAMLPRAASMAWLLLYYMDLDCPPCGSSSQFGFFNAAAQDYWYNFGRAVYSEMKSSLKVTDDIRGTAAAVIGNTTDPDEKLKKLYDFCNSNIKRTNDDVSELTADELARMKPNKSPSETLARKTGTGKDIDLLFIALANASGLEAHYAMLGDRQRPSLDPSFPAPFLLNSYNVAVKIKDRWKFVDPAIKYQPFGMLRWQEEGVPALVIAEKNPMFVRTPISSPEKSVTKRNATLRLSEDGTLEGDIKLYFLGHFGAEEKELMDGLTSTEREQTIREGVSQRISSAEVTKIQVENEKDPSAIITETYHVRVPGYAQRTGRRLIFQPGYFQQGRPPLFSSSTRTHDIFFPHAWTEADVVTVELPSGFALEDSEKPKSVKAGTSGKHIVELEATPDGRMLKYSRLVSFGLDQTLTYPPSEYANVKRVFDIFHELDDQTVSLVQKPQDSENRP
jgi:hypothetical protein